MKDPYKVLGIEPTATDDEIKSAYRELARKYHPDNYVNSPLSDLAEEKMKEINEAYDEVQKERLNGQKGGSYGYKGYGSTTNDRSANSATYNQVRNLINSGNYAQAESILNSISVSMRGAEWQFLMGCVCVQKGWYFDAQNYFQSACAADPTNLEYRNALNNVRGAGQSFGRGYRTRTGAGASGCDICSSLICADCCCECMGGDLISCC